MPLDSGRKKDPAWREVSDIMISTEGGINQESGKVSCDYCGAVISRKIEHVKTHLAKCIKRNNQTDDDAITIEEGEVPFGSATPASLPSSTIQRARTPSGASSTSAETNSRPNTPFILKRMRSSSIENFIVKTTNEDKKRLDMQLARFWFAGNFPFNAVENKQFIKFCHDLRPGYSPPNRKSLAGELLNAVYDEVKEQTIASMENVETVCLTQDGWSSIQNDPIIAHAFSDGQKTHLLDLIDSGSEKKTAEYCATIISGAINKLKDEYGKIVFAVCTDNEAKMKKLRQLLQTEFPDIVTYGCNAHYLSLLQGDVSNDSVMKHVVEVQKYFRNVHLAHGLLKQKGGKQPQLPNDTRWNSNITCLETFKAKLANHSIYVEVRGELIDRGVNMPNNVAKSIDNIGLMREAGHLLEQMKKFGIALDKLQSEKCTISDACHVWYTLLNDDNLELFRDSISKRFKEAIGPPHILAYMTDPKYMDEWRGNVEQELKQQAEEWLEDLNADFHVEYCSYLIRKPEAFPKLMFSKNLLQKMEASDWWALIKSNTATEENATARFAGFMRSLHLCPASSAGIERWFSTVGYIWSKVRNRLGVEKAMKLATVYRALCPRESDESVEATVAEASELLASEDVFDFDM